MLHSLGAVVSGLVRKEGWQFTLLSEWSSIVGALATKMKVEKIKGSTLIIGVFHPSWLQELYSFSDMIQKTINTYLQGTYITAIQFKSAVVYHKKNVKNDYQGSFARDHKEICLSAQQKKALEKVEDQELQKALHSFLERCVQKKK